MHEQSKNHISLILCMIWQSPSPSHPSAAHQLRWGDREMGTAISCTKCSQVAGLIQKLVEIPRSSKVPSLRPAVLRAAAFRSNILRSDRNR